MSARYLSLPSCHYCSKELQVVIEEDVIKDCTCYTVRCNCTALTTTVAKTVIELGGDDYAVDIAWQRWKEAVDKMHMVSDSTNEENPGSREETGVLDSDAVWEAVMDAMEKAFWNGNQYALSKAPVSNDRYIICENILKGELRKVIDNPPDDPY